MAKVLLVEDDNNLREIYQARLTAEGYEIVAAQNGEDALVLAKQHHPDLIISDVMMPRISGYEMLDILRNTEELKHTKVIMLTALGQNEDKERAGKLGADKYLVKSQVTLEDIVNSAKALLADDSVGGIPQVATPDPADPLGMSTTDQTDDATTMPSVSPVAATITPLNSVVEPPVEAEAAVKATPVEQPEVQAAPQPVAIEPAVAPSAVPSPEALQVASEPVAVPVEAPALPTADTGVATDQTASSTTSPLSEPVSVDSLINGDTAVPEPVIETVPADVDSAQSAESEQAIVDQQIDSFNQQPIAPAPVVQPDTQENTEQQNDATLNDALQTLTTEEPLNPVPNTVSPSTVGDSQEDAVQSHGIEGLSGVNEVVEVPTEPHVDPTPSTTASVIPPVVEHSVPEVSEAAPITQTVAPTEMPQTPAAEPATGPDNDGVNVVGKKVIQPLSDPNSQPDLDKLLAQEEARQTGDVLPQPTVGGEPSAPEGAPTPKPANGFDPNSIAL